MTTKTRSLLGAVLVLAVAAFAVAVVASAGDDEAEQARQTDGAFLTGMVPHHDSAVEMAEVARERARRPEIRRLAGEIIAAQKGEIRQMRAAHERLFGEPLPGPGAHGGGMGMSAEEMGMEGMDMEELERAKPFERAFIDAMIPHHQGAIRMARVELERGQDAELKRLARAVVDAQSREIAQMNRWRRAWYGAASPAGGVPVAGAAPSHRAMGHQ